MDKLRARQRQALFRNGVVSWPGLSEDQVVASSARTGGGADELLDAIAALLAGGGGK